MKIEAGKYYKTRDGRTVGPIQRGNPNDPKEYWKCGGSMNGFICAWFEDGSFWPVGHCNRSGENSVYDLIAPAYPGKGTLKEIGAKVGDVVEYIETGNATTITHMMDGAFYGTGINTKSPYCSRSIFRIISRASDKPASPVRTVTRKEIVPGVYGEVKVHDPGSKYVRINIDAAMDITSLTAAIETLTQIRDAMEDKQ